MFHIKNNVFTYILLYIRFFVNIYKKNGYNTLMDATDTNQIVKMLLLKENMTITKLAKLLSTNGKKYYQQTLSAKLLKGTLKVNELLEICRILKYEIDFKKINPNRIQ